MTTVRATQKLTLSFCDDMQDGDHCALVINPGDELVIEGKSEDGLYSVTHVRTGVQGLRLTEQEFERA